LQDQFGEPNYLTLDQALAQGLTHITEISTFGSVPELRFVNEADIPILLLDGEELVGAKQNRVLNLTILAPARTNLTVPVSCVEAGRWTHQSEKFSSTSRALYAAGRARKMTHVTEALHDSAGRSRHSNQGEVWADIRHKSARMAVHSNTEAMSEMYEQNENLLEKHVEAFTPEVNQCGAIFAVNGRVVGLELFDYDISFRTLLPKLVRSYALDALEKQNETKIAPSHWSVEALLQEVGTAKTESFRAVGMGDDVRLTGDTLTGGALIVENRIVHLSAFRRPATLERNFA